MVASRLKSDIVRAPPAGPRPDLPLGPVMEGVDGLKPVVQCRGLEVAC